MSSPRHDHVLFLHRKEVVEEEPVYGGPWLQLKKEPSEGDGGAGGWGVSSELITGYLVKSLAPLLLNSSSQIERMKLNKATEGEDSRWSLICLLALTSGSSCCSHSSCLLCHSQPVTAPHFSLLLLLMCCCCCCCSSLRALLVWGALMASMYSSSDTVTSARQRGVSPSPHSLLMRSSPI